MSRYRSISLERFSDRMTAMGFAPMRVPGCLEHVFERVITNGPNPGRFSVRIYSSIDDTGHTRDVGGDAIRVLLMDTVFDRPALDWRVYRTENALDNMHARARDAWGYTMNSDHHCSCGALMVERSSRNGAFMGCTNYPHCRRTRPVAAPTARAA